jgi:WD40 repeat protein
VSLAPDEGRLAVPQDYKWVCVFDLSTGAELCRVPIPAGPRQVRFDPSGRRLAVACQEQAVALVLDSATGAVLATLPHAAATMTVAWHPDDKHLAVGAGDRLIRLWDVESQVERASLVGHQGDVLALRFTHQGHLLASAGWDGALRLWSFPTGDPILSRSGGGAQLRFSPDDRQLSCHSWDGPRPRLYEIAPGSELRTLHERRGGARLGEGTVAFSRARQILTELPCHRPVASVSPSGLRATYRKSSW